MGLSNVFLAYLGPETLLPMSSVVAGVLGVLMMFGRFTTRCIQSSVRAIVSRTDPRPKTSRKPRRIGAGPVSGIVRREASRSGLGD
jgi:hypothetical protein